jgi:hypothetical protein
VFLMIDGSLRFKSIVVKSCKSCKSRKSLVRHLLEIDVEAISEGHIACEAAFMRIQIGRHTNRAQVVFLGRRNCAHFCAAVHSNDKSAPAKQVELGLVRHEP